MTAPDRLTEKTYTLAEAEAELQRRECVSWGHSWDVISTMIQPIGIRCRCGASFAVVTHDRIAELEAERDDWMNKARNANAAVGWHGGRPAW